jgi:asparagine synthase (glutamine-hydrolysing)
MCGIGGFWGGFEPSLLEGMNDALVHRGPDDGDVYFDRSVQLGLAHRRLSIIDPNPRGRQPMWDSTESVCTIYNGELYNYRDLKRGLVRDGFEFRTETDTEVLVNLYRRDGPSMLESLNGMYAFAIWAPERNEMFIARDGLGIKPLYYTEIDRGFLFGSELKALLQEQSVSRSLNPRAVNSYLTYLWSPGSDTMLAEVDKLEPGKALRVRTGEVVEESTFYDLPYDQEVDDISKEQAVERVRSSVGDAVERQLVSDVPVGAFLSGGLDSSAVVAMYRKAMPEADIDCFTIRFGSKGGGSDEWAGFASDLPYAKQVARELDVDLHVVEMNHETIERLPEMIYHLDEPQADPAPLNALLISELARDKGIKVLLSGAGGDDIFTGYRRHFALQLERVWGWLPKPVRRLMSGATSEVPVSNSWGRRFRKAFRYAHLDGDDRLASYFYWLPPDQTWGLYSDGFREELRGQRTGGLLRQTLDRLPDNLDRLNRMLYLEGKHFLPDHNLNYTDKMSMATGVEVRVPLIDRELVDDVVPLPPSYKQRGRVGKWVFKRAMEPYLPNDVIYRPKTGFGAPLRRWLDEELKPLRRELLSRQSLKNRGLFDPNAVADLVQANTRGDIDAAYPIFSLMCIELWCRMFVDKTTPSPVDFNGL